MLPICVISEANPYYILLGACMLFSVLGCVYLWRTQDDDEWRASSLRAGTGMNESQAARSITPRSREQSRFQRFMEFPLLQPWLSIGIGFIVPVALVLILAGEIVEDTRYELATVFGATLLWNWLFALVFKFPLRLPYLPIPLAWVAALFTLLGIGQICFGASVN